MARTSISITGEALNDSITEINCGFSSPKIGGDINISIFPELTGFYCTGNDIQNISDITNNTKLKTIDISYNQLTQIPSNLSKNLSLEYVNCAYNEITGQIPNLQNNSFLTYFNCSYNDFTGFNGGIMPPKLKYFEASNNDLEAGAVDSILQSFINANSTSGYLNLSGSNKPPTSLGLKILASNGSNFTRSGNLVTANVSQHNFSNQEIVTIKNITNFPNLNGTYVISRINSNQFQYNTTGIGFATGAGSAALLSTSNSADPLKLYQILNLPVSQGGRGWDAYIAEYFIQQLGDTIYGDDIFESFGSQVAINGSGTRIISSSPTYNEGEYFELGKITILDWNGEDWISSASQVNPINRSDSLYGYSIAMSENGNRVAIGCPYGDISESTSYAGFTEVLNFNGSIWNRIGSLISGDNNFENCGSDVSLNSDGSITAVASQGFNGNLGRVRIFKLIGGNWVQLGQSLEGGPNPFDEFGARISLSDDGNVIAISARVNHRVLVYKYEILEAGVDNWKKIGEFNSLDFVRSVSLNNDGTILAFGENGNINGSVSIYKYNGGTSWSLLGSKIVKEEGFGDSLSLNKDGTHIVVGSPFSFDQLGSVRIYKYINLNWKEIGIGSYGKIPLGGFGSTVSINSSGDRFVAGTLGYTAGNYVEVYELLD